MSNWIPHSRPTLPGPEEWADVFQRLQPGWVADGPQVAEFERRASEVLGGAGGIAVGSGTMALQLALTAAGVRPGDEVLIPAYCCSALLHAVRQAGGLPVLVDSEGDRVTLCPHDAARRITPRSRAIVVTHLFGVHADVKRFRELDITVIEDCAQSFGARHGGAALGSAGRFAIASFFATKVITTGHGGLVSANRMEDVAGLRDLIEYDNREDDLPRFSCRISEMQAALGNWQLEGLPKFLRRRAEIAREYANRAMSAGVPGQVLSPVPAAEWGSEDEREVCYRFVMRVREVPGALDWLAEQGIGAKRPVFLPLQHYTGGDFPASRRHWESLISLPIYPSLTDDEVERVAGAINQLALERPA